MKAGIVNIEINQGCDYAAILTLREAVLNSDGTVKLLSDGTPDRSGDPLNLEGYTYRAEIRTAAGGTLIVVFTVATVVATSGTLQIALTAAQTKLLTDTEYVYDLEATSAGVVRRIIQGKVLVSPEVTQPAVEA